MGTDKVITLLEAVGSILEKSCGVDKTIWQDKLRTEAALGDHVVHNAIRIFLPKENRGIKTYNGVSHWY